jgi:hypothetical protein
VERVLIYDKDPELEEENNNARDIVEKIKVVNDRLKSPNKREQIKYSRPYTGGDYVIDNKLLEKIQHIIAAGKLNPLAMNQKYQDGNSIGNDIYGSVRFSKKLPFAISQYPMDVNQLNQEVPLTPYVTSLPVILVPLATNMQSSSIDFNQLNTNTAYQTRQRPTIPWPLAPLFPILIRDPLLNILGGGGLNNIIEVGQSADVCNRKQKSTDENQIEDTTDNIIKLMEVNGLSVPRSRQGRVLKKRSVDVDRKVVESSAENVNKVKKGFLSLRTTTKKPSTIKHSDLNQQTKNSNEEDGDVRFTFGESTWFGNRRPVTPINPGFFINKLKVRRGGVAIAGPGGVATAGRGGTAIVGPGGLAYTQPGGLAVAGPAAKIVALSPDVNLSSLVTRLQEQSENSSVPRSISQLLEAVPEGKVVATGPIIYYHPKNET